MYNCYTPRYQPGGEELPPTSHGRVDGRAWNQFRPTFMDVGMISQASGSAYVEVDHTKVVCAVYGPRARQDVGFSDMGKLLVDLRYAPFARRVRKERAAQNEDEKALSQLVVQALEASIQLSKLPKSVIEVYVTVLQADGAELGAAISCASLALADSGIDLYGLVAACTVASLTPLTAGESSSPRLVLDPTSAEEASATGGMSLALMPCSGEVTQWRQDGRMEARAMDQALELATDGCMIVHGMMKNRLIQSVVRGGDKQKDGSMDVS